MSVASSAGEAKVFIRWVKATTLGWLLGFVLVVVLAVVWDQVGGGAQFMVGMGMGAGVALGQARIVEEEVGWPGRWIWSTTFGMGIPFLVWDLGAVLGADEFFSLPLCVVAGSLFVGVLQGRLLSRRYRNTIWWIPANLVGWGVPVAVLALGDSGVLSGAGGLVSVAAMLSGGAALGAITGKALVSMPTRPTV